MMRFSSFQVNSLFIDRIGNRWISRGLFLFVLILSIATNLWPIGDTDFSKYFDSLDTFLKWMNTYSNASITVVPTAIVWPVLTAGNVLFLTFSFLMVFVYVLISVIYAHVYVGEKIGLSKEQISKLFLSRLPQLILFFLIIVMLTVFFNFFFLFLIPALFFAPILIFVEKKNPIDSILYSFRYSSGYKFSIFWNLLTLYCMFSLAEQIVFIILPEGSNAGIFLHGFFMAFVVLAIGRSMGIFYELIRANTLHQNTEQQK